MFSNRYCVCMFRIKRNDKTMFVLDPLVTFPNPDKDATALVRCHQRAKALREELAVKNAEAVNLREALMLPAGRVQNVTAVVITEPVEDRDGSDSENQSSRTVH